MNFLWRRLRDLPIRRKTAFVVLSASAVGFAAMLMAVLFWDHLTARDRLERETSATALLVANHLDVTLAFDDVAAAQAKLAALQAEPEITAACAYRVDGSIFAAFQRRGSSPEQSCPRTLRTIRHRGFVGEAFEVLVPVLTGDEDLGYLYLRAEVGSGLDRLRPLLPLLLVVLFVLLTVSLWLAALLGRTITGPLMGLSTAVDKLGDHYEYGAPLPHVGADEIGRLTGAFDSLMRRVREREKALARSNTERGMLLEDLRAALRVRDEFLSIASHELRTPLSVLILQIGTVSRRLERDGNKIDVDWIAGRTAQLAAQAARLDRLIGSLLDVSRIMAGRLTLSPEAVDLAALVRERIDMFCSVGATAPVSLNVPAAITVIGQWDRLRVEQVIENLLSNAFKYGEGKPVEVSIELLNDRVQIAVRDQGMGIAAENVDRIFGRFERAVSERHFGGFGLGLWIVRQIVEAMGGTVAVDSTPGKGSIFLVTLPLTPTSLPTDTL